jgi:carboxyl-terminal processing protease
VKQWLYLAALAAMLAGCGGADDDDDAAPDPQAAAQCTVAAQRQDVRSFMQANYYWYRNMPAPDESAPTMDAYFQSMLYRPQDRFSYTTPTADYNQVFTEGRRIGYGYSLVWTDTSRQTLRVRYVEPQSPVARAGLRRGDTIVSIDGYSPAQIAQGALPAVTTAGVPRVFVIASPGGGQFKQVNVVSEDFALQPVTTTAVFDAPGPNGPEKVGYLSYTQFVTYSLPALQDAFVQFANAGVSDLILDMRYNGGGSVGTSRDLASLVGGNGTVDRLYAYLRFNDKQASKTTSVLFTRPAATAGTPLEGGLKRLFVIASGGTASASELVINGLRPLIPVVLIGETTYGKPYGFVPHEYCGTTYQAVQFESLNSLGVGGYTAGFAPDCAVADDLEHQLGDPHEARIDTALTYIATGTCGPAAKRQILRQAPAGAPIGESRPPGMFLDR